MIDLFPHARWFERATWLCLGGGGDGGGGDGASAGDTGDGGSVDGGYGGPGGWGTGDTAAELGGSYGYASGATGEGYGAAFGGGGDSGGYGGDAGGGGIGGGTAGGLSGLASTQEGALAALQGYSPGLYADLTYHTAPATDYNPLSGAPQGGPQGFFSGNPGGLGPASYTSFETSNPGLGTFEGTLGVPAFDLSSPGFNDAPPGPSFGGADNTSVGTSPGGTGASVGLTGSTGTTGGTATGGHEGAGFSGFTGGVSGGGTQGAAGAALGSTGGPSGSAADGNSGGMPGAMQVAVPGDFPAIQPTPIVGLSGRGHTSSFGTINGRGINPNMPAYLRALGYIESTSNYNQQTNAGRGRVAVGRYQIMSDQIGDWTQQALGTRMSAREFLDNPEAQDRTAAYHFQGYLNQYGTPQMAAAAWMSPAATARGQLNGVSDRFGTTPARHATNFLNALTSIQSGRVHAAPIFALGDRSDAMISSYPTAVPGPGLGHLADRSSIEEPKATPGPGLGHLSDITTVPQPVPTPAPRPGDSFDSRFGGGFKGPAPGAIAGLVSQPVPAPRPGDITEELTPKGVVPPVFSTPETRDTFDARFGTWPQVDTFDDRFGGFKAPPPSVRDAVEEPTPPFPPPPTEELPDVFPTLPPPPVAPPPVATPPVAPPPTVAPPPAVAGKGPGPIAGPGPGGNRILPFPGPMIPQGGNGIAPVPGGVQPISPNMIPPGGGLAALQAGSMKPLTPREMALLRMQGLA